MLKEQFIEAFSQQLTRFYKTSDGHSPSSKEEQLRCEGFMEAGIQLGLITSNELKKLINEIHYAVYGMSLDAKKSMTEGKWQQKNLDYSAYDQPTYERRKR